MENKALLEKYRNRFSLTLALTILVTSSFEIIAYFIFVHIGRCSLSFSDPYLLTGVILPIIVNLIIYAVITAFLASNKITYRLKNEVVIIGAAAVSFVISVVHREYIVTSCAFMFPMVFSAMFNDKQLIFKTFLMSLASTTVTFVLSCLDNNVDLTAFMNYIVMYGFLIVSFLGCILSVKYAQLNIKTIEAQAQTNKYLKNIVLLDQMTGLYNHRTFYTELDSAIDGYSKNNKSFCLAMIDIDHFKHINDMYGHDCGDIVINNLAEIMKGHCEISDKAFRYGGEEFAIIYIDKDLETARRNLEDMLKAFSDTKYPFTDEKITFSGGISSYSGSLVREEFFNIVGKLLYSAKNGGRNQIKSAL